MLLSIPGRLSRRRLGLVSTFTLLAAFSATSFAHGPTRQKAIEKVSIDAPASVVWARIKNFDALKDWHPAVASSTADKGNAVDSVRIVKLKSGGEEAESLEGYSDEQMKYNYRGKDGGVLPVTNYTSTLQVTPDGDNKSTVEWRGAFYRGHPGNEPPPELNDDAAVASITGVYKGGLANLKKIVEAK